jgi:general secretion pathway protein G
MIKRSNRSGFTLVELMLVVVILSVLAVAIVPRLAGRTEQAKIARSKSDMAAIGLALDLYELDLGKYPETLTALNDASAAGETDWSGPYLKKGLPKDPWGREYVYSRDSQHSQDYDLYSLGPDGSPGNDDITNWAE